MSVGPGMDHLLHLRVVQVDFDVLVDARVVAR
jgi:hypothetical protein